MYTESAKWGWKKIWSRLVQILFKKLWFLAEPAPEKSWIRSSLLSRLIRKIWNWHELSHQISVAWSEPNRLTKKKRFTSYRENNMIGMTFRYIKYLPSCFWFQNFLTYCIPSKILWKFLIFNALQCIEGKCLRIFVTHSSD